MNKVDFEKWQILQDEFLNGELDEVEFCKLKKLNLEWFRKQLNEAERNDSQSDNLFVELIPSANKETARTVDGSLKVTFREVGFELVDGFSLEVFRRALQVVKEVV